MRKIPALLLIAVLAFLSSCEEIGPSINLQEVVSDPDDTSYVLSSIPAAQAKNVFLEDFTGVQCPNCPSAHEAIKALEEEYKGRFVSVGLYKDGLGLTAPLDKSGHLTKDDFRTPLSNAIDQTVYNGQASSLPMAGIDRVKYNNQLLMNYTVFSPAVSARLTVPSPLNIEATSAYNTTDSLLTVKITFTFTQPLTKGVYFTAGIVQDSIIDVQEKGLQIIDNYQHDHVFRGLISGTSAGGTLLPFSNFYEPGRVFVRTLRVKLPEYLRAQSQYLKTEYIRPEHCKVFIIAHHNEGTSEILQAIDLKMK